MSVEADRKEIPWFPTIDGEKCTGCGTCFNFCSHSVYEMKEDKSKVVNPYGCVVGCSTCQGLCPEGAISFPDLQEVRKIIKKLRAPHQ